MTEQSLLTVTSAALQKIDAVRKSTGHPEDLLRIGITGRRGATFEYDFVLVDALGQQPDDIAIDYPGPRVLVDPKSAELLRGTTMDLDPISESFGIDNPNEGGRTHSRSAPRRCSTARSTPPCGRTAAWSRCSR